MTLPSGYSWRTAGRDDVAAVVKLMNDEALELVGHAPVTVEWLSAIWFAPGADLENDVALVVDQAGVIVGALSVESGPPFTEIQGVGGVAIGHHGRGVGAAIVAEIERRAQRFVQLAPAGARVLLSAGTLAGEPRVAELMGLCGYAQGAHSYLAQLDFADTPVPPAPASGIEVRSLAPGQEREVYACLGEAFDDDWESGWPTWEVWQHRYIENRPFDPGLWFVAWDGDAVAGALVGKAESDEDATHGWVSLLGVRPSSRGRGAGSALLQRAFEEFQARGRTGVGLMVTFAEPTAASRLYERLGMRMTPKFVTWEKELRAGG